MNRKKENEEEGAQEFDEGLEALAHLERAMRQENFDKGVAAIESDQYMPAIAYFDKVLEDYDPESLSLIPWEGPPLVDVYNGRALANLMLENFDQGKTDLERTLAIDPNNQTALTWMDNLLAGFPENTEPAATRERAMRQENFDKGIAAIESDHYMPAMAYFDEVLEDYPIAQAAWEQPPLVDVYNGRALANIMLENFDQGKTDLERTLAIDPNNQTARAWMDKLLIANRLESNFNKGVDCLDSGNYQLAVAYFDEVVKDDPVYVGAYVNRSAALMYLGDYQEALCDIERAITIDPDAPHLRENRVFLLKKYPLPVDPLNISERTDFGPLNRYPLETFNKEGVSSVDSTWET